MESNNKMNLQYGSFNSVHTNLRDSTGQDPVAPNLSAGSIDEQFSHLNINEQSSASTAASANLPGSTSGSTTIDHDATKASGHSSPFQHPLPYPTAYNLQGYGSPMYHMPLYGYPFLPPHYLPGYSHFGYSPMLPTPPIHAPHEPIIPTPLASSNPGINSETSSETPETAQAAPLSFTPGSPPTLYLSPKLSVVTSKSGFQHWIQQFILVLKDYGMESLIPDNRGQLPRVPSANEQLSFDSTLSYYVKEDFLPAWFKEATNRSSTKFNAIQRAMVLSLQASDQSHLWAELKSLTYNGSADAFIFISKIRSIIDLFPDSNSASTTSLLKTIIFDALRGSYTSITKKFAQRPSTDYSVNDILNEIQFEYDFSQKYKSSNNTSSTNSSSTRSSASTRRHRSQRSAVCSYCHKHGHNITQCYSKQNAEARQKKRAVPQSRSPRDRVNNISYDDTVASTDSTPDHYLRHRPTLKPFNSTQHLLLDSGSSITLVNNSRLLHNLTQDYTRPSIATSQNFKLSDKGKGILKLQFLNGKEVSIEAYFVPEITDNILSISALENEDVYVNAINKTLESATGILYANVVKSSSLPWLANRHIIIPHGTPLHTVNHLINKYPLDVVHRLFGHVNVQALKKSFQTKTFKHLTHDDIDWTGYTNFQCIDCAQGKSRVHNHIEGARLRYQEKYGPFEFLHSDIFGPVSNSSIAKFFITFIDEYSSYRWVFPLTDKSANTVLDVTTQVVNTINRQFGKTVKAFQFDHGSEYNNKEMIEYLNYNGIQYLFTSVGDSRSHGVAERLNLTFLNDCRTLLKAANFPPHLWIYAVEFSAIIRNAIYNKRIDTSPQALAGLPALDVKTILPFGQPVIVHLSKTTSKLKYRGEQGFALCPSSHSRGYLIYIPKNHKIVDTTNYAILRSGITINSSENYDDSIFDNMITSITSSQEYSMEPSVSEGHLSDNATIKPSHSPVNSNVSVLFTPTSTSTSDPSHHDPIHPASPIIESQSLNADAILRNLDPISNFNNESDEDDSSTPPISHNDDDVSILQEPISDLSSIPFTTNNTQDDPDADSSAGISDNVDSNASDGTTSERIISTNSIDSSDISGNSDISTKSGGMMDNSPTSSNSGGINTGILSNDEKSIFNRKRTRLDEEQTQSNNVGISKKIEENKHKKYKPNDDDNQSISNSNKRITRNAARLQKDNEQISEEQNVAKDDNKENKHKVNRYIVNYIRAVETPQNKFIETDPLSNTMFYNQAITFNKNKAEKKLFEAAYKKEVTQLMKLKTWDNNPINIDNVDPNKIINSMFIFNVKRDNKHKCRLVARGDHQSDGTYKKELVANTVHHYALMICLSNCLSNDYDIIQLDISSAYLYAELEEDLYIRAPPHMKLKNKVFRLRKSLYGLKQSGANWYALIKDYLINKCGMVEVLGWACVFIKEIGNKKLILCLFVDDIILFTNNRHLANILINTLKSRFDTKIINEGNNSITNKYDILGLEIEYQKGESMSFGMGKSIEEKLPKFNINLDIRKNVPGVPGLIPKKEELIVTEKEYKQKVKWMQMVIGLASYIGYKYRFDLLYYINVLARYTLYPSQTVIEMTKQLVQYLWWTRHKKLRWFKNDDEENKDKNRLTVIADAAFASQDNYKSQYGNYYYLNDNVIGGKSSKSTLTCTSSTEAEIYAISESIPRIELFERLINKINDNPISKEIITDSKPSISSFNAIDESRMKAKFFTTRLLRSKEEVKNQKIKMSYIDTKNNTADILTKPVQVKNFKHLTENWIL